MKSTRFEEFKSSIDSIKKNDYVYPVCELKMDENRLKIPETDVSFETSEFFRKQMFSRLAPGLGTYSAFLEKENRLIERNSIVNTELSRQDSERNFLIRTVDNNARACLSDSYKAIDNSLVFDIMSQRIMSDEMLFMNSHLDEQKGIIKMISKEAMIELGDRKIHYGYMASNNEVGQGYMSFVTFLCDRFCMNGVIFSKREIAILKIMHKGSSIGQIGRVNLSVSGLEIDDIRIQLMKAMDVGSQVPNHGLVDRLKFAYEKKLTVPVEVAMRNTLNHMKINLDFEKVMSHVRTGENSIYGIQAAITRMAQDSNENIQLDLESKAGDILSNPESIYAIVNSEIIS